MSVVDLSRALNKELADIPRRAPKGYPELSQSAATTLITKSPLHAYGEHPELGGEPRQATKEMDFGSIIHALLLGKGAKFEVVSGFSDWRKDAAKKQREELQAEGKIALLQHEHERALAVSSILRDKLAARGVVFDGIVERRIRWTETADSGSLVHCAGTQDHVSLGPVVMIDDLKTAASAHPDKFRLSMMNFGYDIQWAAYTRGCDQAYKANGRIDMRFITVEVTRPYCITIMKPAGSMRALGNMRWQRAVNTWDACVRNNHWPEYCEGIVDVDAPNWAIEREGVELDEDF